MDPLPLEAEQAQDLAIDTLGRIVEFWGFPATMGRIFGLLYLSPAPLGLQEVCQRLAISAGSASMTLQGLLRWRVVRKLWIKGDRHDYYEAETDFWRMISGVLNDRERREIELAVESMDRALALAKMARGRAKLDERKRIDLVMRRLDRLYTLFRLGGTLLDTLLSKLRLDVGKHLGAFKHYRT